MGSLDITNVSSDRSSQHDDNSIYFSEYRAKLEK